jgi:arabinose-5-phosphate isomerase
MAAPAEVTRILADAREVLEIEGRAVLAQRSALDAGFVAAVRRLRELIGKIVVIGVGKSGLIGRKLSATFSSLGMPAVFLHPVEFQHGDSGALMPGDVVLALSHSGETEEVKRILPMIRSLGAGVIAMTGRRSSYLGRTADITIVTPVAREACPYNVAPTASTTVMLATGDALAVAAARLRGFRREDFARLHPAGRLGKLLTLRVRDVMRTGAANPVVKSGSSVMDALRIMSRTRLGATSIVGPQRLLVGYFTDGDLRRCIQKDPRILVRRIDQVMTRSPRTVGPDELLSAAQATMKRYHCDNVPVTDARGRIIGILDERDILQEGL